ncbi:MULTISPECIES: PspA/IM30 family protein [unclassified Thermosynechococcus]|uniref:PspA/IM30 family protein n=1 Tax=unclassified Thermosynechococcus TaxID=2622553 RepID=UPI002872E3D3|nr:MULTISPECIES: PspA/IM30 family protein [unclassified Thermosynechococcus]WNC32141.1 PspA/IM30 family protein [Thermosynechococcus sp. PKX95]WNC34669.1 PspA/IM30 family protein [Thermosynechococcus sp. PKX91]WNC37186.1 PspA/IM30 family protein [Thermosynechococcus sp. WL11]WNC39708.1 PspA/IM30 family protein [Thermosynechococcus sp. WL17]WNC42228.1 PspA/IM30 family protein [Thermosynechococcus sp. WL15]
MGLLDRVGMVIRSNLNAIVSAAEDPEKILEQTIIDMNEDLVKLRQAVAQAIAAQKRLEQQYAQNLKDSQQWEERARLALSRGDEALALEALNRKKTAADTAAALKAQVDQMAVQVKTLKDNLTALESKISEAKTKKEMLKARVRAAKASEQIHQAVSKVGTSNAMAAFERMEDKVLQMEARSQAIAELSGDTLESKFQALQSSANKQDVEFELVEMKRQMGLLPDAPSAGTLPQTSSGSSQLNININVSTPEVQDAPRPSASSQSKSIDDDMAELRRLLDS